MSHTWLQTPKTGFLVTVLISFFFSYISLFNFSNEPQHDKTNKISVCQVKTDQPGHLPSLIRVFAVRMKKPWVLSYPLSAQQRLWSDREDAQADQSLRWANTHFVGFVKLWLKFPYYPESSEFSFCLIKLVSIRKSSFLLLQMYHMDVTKYMYNYHMNHVTRKLAFGSLLSGNRATILECAATEARWRLEILCIETRGIILSSEKQRCWSHCEDAQADLRLCCSHMAKMGFFMTRLIYIYI